MHKIMFKELVKIKRQRADYSFTLDKGEDTITYLLNELKQFEGKDEYLELKEETEKTIAYIREDAKKC